MSELDIQEIKILSKDGSRVFHLTHCKRKHQDPFYFASIPKDLPAVTLEGTFLTNGEVRKKSRKIKLKSSAILPTMAFL